ASAWSQLFPQRFRGPRAVGVLRLPLVAELRDRLLLAGRDEDRVEAEAGRAVSLERDPAFERAGAAELPPVGRDRDELADVAGAPVLDPGERVEDPLHMPALRPARSLDAGLSSERLDLE